MKRIFLSASAIALCVCMSCNNADKGGMSDTAKKNLDANNAIMKMLETGDVSKMGDYIAVDALDHSQMGDIKGLDSIKASFIKMAPTMKSFKNTTIKEVADDEYVFSWGNSTGNNTDPSMGPLGPMSMSSVEVSKFKDGKAIEHWSFLNCQDVMKMMPPPPAAGDMKPMEDHKMAGDTGKMK
jgi:predicted SnoaL-like aldol condensation-catalyzing enzyme